MTDRPVTGLVGRARPGSWALARAKAPAGAAPAGRCRARGLHLDCAPDDSGGSRLLHIFVDADACPVKEEVYRVARRYHLDVTLVANSWMRTPNERWIALEVVEGGLDVADDWIVEYVRPDDIVVTADIPLASRCLKEGARVIGITGRPFTADNIGQAMTTRNLLSELRGAGEITGGPPPLKKSDRSLFLQQLDEVIQAIRRDHPDNCSREQMDRIYRELPLDEIPWNVESPPAALVDLVDSGWVQPSDAVDLGCGAGNYAVWLASKGFRVTGLDLSPCAIELATGLAKHKNVTCRFMAQDMTGVVKGFDNAFDFAFDWEVLHHVFPEDRGRYVMNVHRMLRSGGKYFSLCFSEDEPPSFGGNGEFRKTPLGTTLYFSSEGELRELFEPLFVIERLCTVEVAGKRGHHLAVKALMSKKGA